MLDKDLAYKITKADASMANFVERFWMLANHSDKGKDMVVIPDGRIDILFSCSATEPFHITLMGLETGPKQTVLPARTIMFAVNLKLLAVEYLLDTSISTLLNGALGLPDGFWGIGQADLDDFDRFCEKLSSKIKLLLPKEIDNRKQQLFNLVYASDGSCTVQEYSRRTYWNSRQINRYFSQQFGLSLKAYCSILRFRASLQHIKAGKLFPEGNFTDQAHFIREIKRLSGVVPKELFRNKNDRFIQFSTLPKN